MKRAAVIITLLGFVLAGCGSSISSGTVIAKTHEDARYYEAWDYCKTRMPVTKTRIITTYVNGKSSTRPETYTDWECYGGYVTRYDDEDWKIQIEKCKESGTQGVDGGVERKCKYAWKEIDSQEWSQLAIGDYYGKPASANV